VNRFDVAVVGAGPAGSLAAAMLAKRGARVALIDPSHPREKPCGGGVTGRALALVAESIAAAAVPTTRIRSARFVSNADRDQAPEARSRVDLTAGSLIVANRKDIDAALLAAAVRAGATHDTSRVMDIAVDAHGVTLATTYGDRRADAVIGADGANSLVRRRVSGRFRRDQLSIATGFFAHGITSDEIVIELIADPPGYIWSFPRPDHLAIGVCAQADAGVSADTLRTRTLGWMRASRIAEGSRLESYSWPIPSLSAHDVVSTPRAGSRWMLAGDAAGLVDPITREGIYFAFLSGDWAAGTLLAGAPSAQYATRVADEIGTELARAARLKAGFFRPAFTGLLMRALQQSAEIRGVMADLIAGTQGYADLKWRLLRTFEAGLVWRGLTRVSSP
jgi:geranylgeranyl reductase family protein